MTEIALKIGSNEEVGNYKDGDILEVFSDTRIHSIHAHNICKKAECAKHNELNLRSINSLLYKLKEKTMQYKFVQIDQTTLRRINLLNSTYEDYNTDTNLFFIYKKYNMLSTSKKYNQNHEVFGDDAQSQEWFGGTFQEETSKINEVWTAIEQKTELKKADHSSLSLSSQERKSFLFLPSANLEADLAQKVRDVEFGINEELLNRSDIAAYKNEFGYQKTLNTIRLNKFDNLDKNSVSILQRRRGSVSWQDIVDSTYISAIQDKTQEVDIRETCLIDIDQIIVKNRINVWQ